MNNAWRETELALQELNSVYIELEKWQPKGRPVLATPDREITENGVTRLEKGKSGEPASPEWSAWNLEVQAKFRDPARVLGDLRYKLLKKL